MSTYTTTTNCVIFIILIIEISIRWALDTFGLIQKRLLNYDMYLLIGNHFLVRKFCHVLTRMFIYVAMHIFKN